LNAFLLLLSLNFFTVRLEKRGFFVSLAGDLFRMFSLFFSLPKRKALFSKAQNQQKKYLKNKFLKNLVGTVAK